MPTILSEKERETTDYLNVSGSSGYSVEGLKSEVDAMDQIKIIILNQSLQNLPCAGIVHYVGSLPIVGLDKYNSYCSPFYSEYQRLLCSNLSSPDWEFIETVNFNALYAKYQKSIEGYLPQHEQEKRFLELFRLLSKSPILNISAVEITVSADDELLVVKQNEKGVHYLIVDKEPGEIFYGFSGKAIGDYHSVKHDENNSLNHLINMFLPE